jgi:hypothetical protein
VSRSLPGKLSLLNSRLLLDKYVASLALDAVSLVRLRSGFKSKIIEKWYVETQHVDLTASSNDQPWSGAVLALEKLLMKSQGGLPMTIVLSNQLVRYKIIPAMPPLTASEKIVAVATHCFRETYGDIVDDWLIRVNPLPDGDTLIASAVDGSLVSALEKLTQKYKCKLKSIQPYLMSGFNPIRRQIKTSPSCYVQVEAGRINIALIRDGAWQSIAGCGVGLDWSEPLSALITREMLLAGWQHEQLTIYLDTPNTAQDVQAGSKIVNSTAWKVVQVPSRAVADNSVVRNQCFAMALSVAG